MSCILLLSVKCKQDSKWLPVVGAGTKGPSWMVVADGGQISELEDRLSMGGKSGDHRTGAAESGATPMDGGSYFRSTLIFMLHKMYP